MIKTSTRWVFILMAVAALGTLLPARADAGPMSLPLHGNWCGPDYPSNAREASFPPIDPLDAACYQHDACYAARNTGDCGCDLAFMSTLRQMRYPTPGLEEKGRAMYDAIGLSPCDNPFGMASKQRHVWSDMAWDTVTGRKAPWALPERLGKLGMAAMENKIRHGW